MGVQMASQSNNLQEVQVTEKLKQQEGANKSGSVTEAGETVKKDASAGGVTKEAAKELKEPVDQYIPGTNEGKEPYGRYEPVSDKKGGFKIEFSAPEDKQVSGPDAQIAEAKENAGGESLKNMDEAGVQKLKMKRKELKQQIKVEADPQKIKDLKRKLMQIEQKLKNNGK